jgi:hypothetical protein
MEEFVQERWEAAKKGKLLHHTKNSAIDRFLDSRQSGELQTEA